jgi:hypothetical protein
MKWEIVARGALAEGRGSWDRLTREEQAYIISDWTEREGRIEMLDLAPVDIIHMVADLYDPELDMDKRQALTDVGKMVCAAFALAARRSAESMWKREGGEIKQCTSG